MIPWIIAFVAVAAFVSERSKRNVAERFAERARALLTEAQRHLAEEEARADAHGGKEV